MGIQSFSVATPTPVQTNLAQGTSLAQLMSIAQGAQAYQQAQQLNPLAAQKAQMEIEQLQQTNPLAVREKAAQTTTAETGATKSKAELQAYYKDQSRKTYGGLLTDKDFDPLNPNPEGMKVKLQEASDFLTNVLGVPEHESKANAKLLEHIDKHGVAGAQRIIQQIANGVQQSGTTSEQFAQANRLPTAITTGKETILIPTSKYQAGQPSTTFRQELSPEARKSVTQLDPVSGDTIVYDIDQNGQPTNIRFLKGQSKTSTSVSPDVAPNKSPYSQFGKPPPQENVPQSVPQGSTAETVKAQATDAMNTFMSSSKLLSDASSLGHIPTQEDITKKLLTYIKDPKVRTGPIADALADASKEEILTSKEQTVKKLIQQRIQNLSPRTDADAESKRAAYGSFKLKKEALEDLIRDDLGSISSQKLLAQGVVKAGGDPNRPNLQGVNTFKNDFTKFSQNKVLMKYIGIVGTKNTTSLDDSDIQALKKLYSTYKISKDDRNALENAREELIKMSDGGR